MGPRYAVGEDGHVYFLGTEGRLTCLDAANGNLIWEKDFKKDYVAKTAIWGFARHPFVDGKAVLLVGGEGSCVVALDKETGNESRSLDAGARLQ